LGFSKKWENVNFQSLILYVSFLEPQGFVAEIVTETTCGYS
jgi:hypothetical protein